MLIAFAKHIIKPMYCIYGSKTGCDVGEPQGRMLRYSLRFCAASCPRPYPCPGTNPIEMYRMVYLTHLKPVEACFQIQATVSCFFNAGSLFIRKVCDILRD